MARRTTTGRRSLVLLGGSALIAGGLGAALLLRGSEDLARDAPATAAPALGETPFARAAPEVPAGEPEPLRTATASAADVALHDVRGRVLHADGSAAPNREVGLYRMAVGADFREAGLDGKPKVPLRGSLLRRTTSDDDGGFAFEDAPVGPAVVSVAPGTVIETSRTLHIGHQPVDQLRLRLPACAVLSGQLVEHGVPAEGVWTVMAKPVDAAVAPGKLALDKSDSRFEIPDLALGAWDVFAYRGPVPMGSALPQRPADGQPGLAICRFFQGPLVVTCLYLGRVRLPLAAPTTFDVSALRSSELRVRVSRDGASCPDATVSLSVIQPGGDCQCVGQYPTREDGSVRLPALWPAEYELEVRAPGVGQSPRPVRVMLGSGESLALELQVEP